MTVMDIKIEIIRTEGCEFLLGAFQFVGVSKRNKMPHTRRGDNMDLARVKYNNNPSLFLHFYCFPSLANLL